MNREELAKKTLDQIETIMRQRSTARLSWQDALKAIMEIIEDHKAQEKFVDRP